MKVQQVNGESETEFASSDDKLDPGQGKRKNVILGVDSSQDESQEKVDRLQVSRNTKTRKHLDRGSSDSWKTQKKKETKDPEEAKNEERREAIKWGMIHAWGAYEQYAWGYDELQVPDKF